MSQTFIHRNTTSDLSVSGSLFNHSLLSDTATLATINSGSLAAEAEVSGYAWTDTGVPGTDGDTGDYTVEWNITTGEADISISVQLARVNSSGVVQNESSLSSEQVATAGIKTFSFTNVNLGTWAEGDRLRVRYRIRNTRTHPGNREIAFSTNTTNDEVVTPFVETLEEITGSGALATGDSSLSGSGVSSSTGSGVLGADSSEISGSGSVGDPTIEGSGVLGADESIISGEGTSASDGEGSLEVDDSFLSGEGLSESTGDGTLEAQESEIEGSGTVGEDITGSGELITQSSTLSGEGVSQSTGTGSLESDESAIESEGKSESAGTGELISGDSGIEGSGDVADEDVITGSGELKPQDSQTVGEGTSSSEGEGTLLVAQAILIASGITSSTGEGELESSESVIVGNDEVLEDITGEGLLLSSNSTIFGTDKEFLKKRSMAFNLALSRRRK
jgi:hypothetical protein